MLNSIGSILSFSFYEGLLFGLIAVGMYLTFRMLNFPDLGVEGSFPLGGAVVAILIVKGVNPFLATPVACVAGMLVGLTTATLNTKLRIPALLCGIIMIVVLWSINLRIMDGANVSLLREATIFDHVADLLGLNSGLHADFFTRCPQLQCCARSGILAIYWCIYNHWGLGYDVSYFPRRQHNQLRRKSF